MWKKAHNAIDKVCECMEVVIAAIVALVVIVVMIFWMPGEIQFMYKAATASNLMGFLEQIMHFVVAIEFIKLMCKPTTENLIEVLEFLIARHMIVGENTVQDLFFSVLAIVMLILAKKITRLTMFWLRRKEEEAKRDGTWNFSEEDEKPTYEYVEPEESDVMETLDHMVSSIMGSEDKKGKEKNTPDEEKQEGSTEE